MAAPAIAAAGLLVMLPPWPREVFATGSGFYASMYGSVDGLRKAVGEMQILYYRDGVNVTISVDRRGEHLLYRSNGKTDASTYPDDLTTQLLLGHVPVLLHPEPRDVFILGLGTGVTASAVARHPVRRIDVAELEPAAVGAARLFEGPNRAVLDDPRVRVVLSDGRNRLLASTDRYDVIISDPSDIWVAGVGSLYTREFYEIARSRLNPGGVMMQWVHTHSLAPAEFALMVATYRASFPHMGLWASSVSNVLLVGSADPVVWDYGLLTTRMSTVEGLAEDLAIAGIRHPIALFAAFVLGEERVARLVESTSRLHTDDLPLLEFITPRSLYASTAGQIYDLLQGLQETGPPAMRGLDPAAGLDAQATHLLGLAYGKLGRPGPGIAYLERSVAMAPDRADYHAALGDQLRAVGLEREALAAYQRAISLDGGQIEALLALGEMSLDRGAPGRALAGAEAVLRLDRGNDRARPLSEEARARLGAGGAR